MILTVEIPQQGRPSCRFAFDEADFIRKVRATRPAMAGVIFNAGSARELLAARSSQAGRSTRSAPRNSMPICSAWPQPMVGMCRCTAPTVC